MADGYLLLRIPAWQALEGRGRWSIGRIADHLAQAFDALGLAAFSVVGVIVAVEAQASPLWLWGPILAALTGAGGGILRDVFRVDPNMPTLKGEFYAEVALIWGFLFSLYLAWYVSTANYDPRHIFTSVLVTLVGAFLTRIAALYFRIRSPLY